MVVTKLVWNFSYDSYILVSTLLVFLQPAMKMSIDHVDTLVVGRELNQFPPEYLCIYLRNRITVPVNVMSRFRFCTRSSSINYG